MKESISSDTIFLTGQQVCARLNISKSSFYKEVDALRLRITYCSGMRVHIDDLNDYVQRIRAGNYAPAYSEDDPWVLRYRAKSAPRKVAAKKRAQRERAPKRATKDGSKKSSADSRPPVDADGGV